MTVCFMCRNEAETQHLDLYIIGSEGVHLCLRCRLELTRFIDERSSHHLRQRRDEYAAKRKNRHD